MRSGTLTHLNVIKNVLQVSTGMRRTEFVKRNVKKD